MSRLLKSLLAFAVGIVLALAAGAFALKHALDQIPHA
jgi:hypothetical protein